MIATNQKRLVRAGKDAAIATAYVIAYVALDWISYLYPLAPFAITPWNPPPGLSVALLTIAGLRFWPAVLIAVVLAEILVRGGVSHPLSTAATSLAFAVGYVGVAAFLLKVVRFDPHLRRVRDVVWLVSARPMTSSSCGSRVSFASSNSLDART